MTIHFSCYYMVIAILIILSNSLFSQSTTIYEQLTSEGLELLKDHNIPAAIIKYKQALKIKHNGVEAHYGLGVCYSSICIQNGHYCNEAINHFLEVEKIAKGYRNTFRNVSTCYIKTYQYENAIIYCNKALKQNLLDNESYFYRGVAKIELKRFDEGCSDLKKASELGCEQARQKLTVYCK